MLLSVPLQITSLAGKNIGNGGLYVLRDISESHNHTDVLKEAQGVGAGKTHTTTLGLLHHSVDVSYRVPGQYISLKTTMQLWEGIILSAYAQTTVSPVWGGDSLVLLEDSTGECTHTHQLPPEQDRDQPLCRSLASDSVLCTEASPPISSFYF